MTHTRIPEDWIVRRVPSACDSDDHFSHPYCLNPNWESAITENGGIVVQDAIYNGNAFGWYALGAFPPDADVPFPVHVDA